MCFAFSHPVNWIMCTMMVNIYFFSFEKLFESEGGFVQPFSLDANKVSVDGQLQLQNLPRP